MRQNQSNHSDALTINETVASFDASTIVACLLLLSGVIVRQPLILGVLG
jgi:hypothetical protein